MTTVLSAKLSRPGLV